MSRSRAHTPIARVRHGRSSSRGECLAAVERRTSSITFTNGQRNAACERDEEGRTSTYVTRERAPEKAREAAKKAPPWARSEHRSTPSSTGDSGVHRRPSANAGVPRHIEPATTAAVGITRSSGSGRGYEGHQGDPVGVTPQHPGGQSHDGCGVVSPKQKSQKREPGSAHSPHPLGHKQR